MTLLFKEYCAVAIGGSVGSVMRFAISSWVQSSHHQDYPWGIWLVNLLGCLVIGILAALSFERLLLNPIWRTGLFIGVLGGFTTFSSFSLDTITLLQNGDISSAFFNVFLTVAGCLIATAGGLFLTRALFLLF